MQLIDGTWEVPAFSAGYLRGTGLLGHPGNVAIAGHDDIQGAVFRHLKEVRLHDTIDISSAQYGYRYLVDQVRYVNADEISVLNDTPTPRLTLITCWPDFFTIRAPYNSLRLVVQAQLLDTHAR